MTKKANNYANKLINKYKGYIQVYSDGSVRGPKQCRTARGGYVITHNNNIIESGKTPVDIPNIAMAELTALTKAADIIQKESNKYITTYNDKLVFFCDNKYIVRLAEDTTKCKHQLQDKYIQLQQILFELRQNIIVKIEWLPAHCDIELHDAADSLAVACAIECASVL